MGKETIETGKAFKEGFGRWADEVRAAHAGEVLDVRYTINDSMQSCCDSPWDSPDGLWELLRSQYLENGAADEPGAFADLELYVNDTENNQAFPSDCGIRLSGYRLEFYSK